VAGRRVADVTTVREVVEIMSRLLADQGALVVATDLSGTVTGWSIGTGEVLGVTLEEAIGRPVSEAADIGLNQSDVAQALLVRHDAVWVGDTDVLTRDGRRVRFRTTAAPWTTPDGEQQLVAVGFPLDAKADDDQARDAHRFGALVERGADVAFICDRNFVVSYAGPSLRRLFGYGPGDVVGVSALEFVHPDDQEKLRRQWDDTLAHPGDHGQVEVRGRIRDGTWLWVEVRITNLLDDAVVAGVVLNVVDVDDRHKAVDALAANERLHRSILEAAREGVWVVGLDGKTLFANAKMADLLGTTREELDEGFIWDVFDKVAVGVVRERIRLRALGISDQYEVEITSRRGERRCLLVAGSPLHDAEGNHFANVGMFSDITRRKNLELELARVALHDSLTGLPNQALLFDRLQRLQLDSERTATDMAVLFCDLDRFKEVNQARGHGGGDELLAAVATRLQQVARPGDTVARFGGDEFVILCPATDIDAAQRLATDVCAAVQTPFEISGERVHVSMSVGVAATPNTDREALLRDAASARYRAKERGRARVEVHDTATRTSSDDRLRILMDLQTALDHDALAVCYQPIVRLQDCAPVGVEALMRWHHRELGPISPATFIPIAEDSGLMPRLGAWSLNRACAEVMKSSSASDAWHLAVNMSTRQLVDDKVVDVVRDALSRTGLPAHRLLLEVTETAVVTDGAQATSALAAIRALGVRVAIDDFGTGYSSLSYLRQFPVDTIKIDRSFVSTMTTDGDDLAIVASIVSLAAAVGVHAVAEGVETEEQADALRRLGCPLAQGFLWSHAVPISDLHDTMARIARGQRKPSDSVGTRRQGAPQLSTSPAADEAAVARIIALHQAGASLTTIAAALNADNLTTARGLRWHRSSVARVIADRQYPGMTR
jgi:diguanylate cyclase (GGDEF)-like protein/PAS domain S-box-containing protein